MPTTSHLNHSTSRHVPHHPTPPTHPASPAPPPAPFFCRLEDVVWDQRSLYLVMEQLSCDLREHLDVDPCARTPHACKVGLHTTRGGLLAAAAAARPLGPPAAAPRLRSHNAGPSAWCAARPSLVPLYLHRRRFRHAVCPVPLLYRSL